MTLGSQSGRLTKVSNLHLAVLSNESLWKGAAREADF